MNLRIAYCIPSLYNPGGMERVLTLKANFLSDIYGYEVYIILTDGKNKNPYYTLSPKIHIVNINLNYDSLHKHNLLLRVFKYTLKQLLFKQRLKSVLQTIRPDITISMLRREINFLSKMGDGSIKIGEFHFSRSNYRDFRKEKLYPPIKKLAKRYWMHQLIRQLRKLDCFVVLSHEDREKWIELKNVITLHNPLSFVPEKQSDCSAHQVISAGRYVYEKGFDRLIDAWKIVVSYYPDWILRIYGDGALRDELANQIHVNNLGTNCILEQTVPNIADKYCESSIFVLSSRNEGFGMVLTEAMSCGVPVVSFACPSGPKDIITNGEDGYLVEDGNIKELSARIMHLIENESARKQMGENAKVNSDRFKIEKIMSQWDDLFQSLAKTHKKQ